MSCHNTIPFIMLAFMAFTANCSQKKVEKEKINVVVSILPLAEFTEQIGGDKANVSVMVPPGASPHAYEPTPGQLADVSKAKMYVKIGTPIEFELVWLDKILATNKTIFVCDASSGIERLNAVHNDEHRYEGSDPHVWLSPKNAKRMINSIYTGFATIDPDNEGYYAANTEKYRRQLDRLDKDIEKALEGKTNRKFIVYHPSWSYFANDYKLKQIPIEIKGKEPTARQIRHVIEESKKHGITIVFASPQFNTESAEVIAKEIKGRVVLIDPLEKHYIANMKRIVQALSEAME